jgi:SnoaL-like domain
MPEPTDPVAIARRYAQAYAAFDTDELLAVLAPDVQFRQVNPGGYLQLDSVQAYVNATKEFLDNFERCEAASATAEAFGDRVCTTSRLRLYQGQRTYLMQHSEIITIREGRVVAIDSACSGARPEEAPDR